MKIPKFEELCLFIMPTLAGVGIYAPIFKLGGAEIFAFRALILALVPIGMLYFLRRGLKWTASSVSTLILFVIWVFFGITSLSWTPEIEKGMVEMGAIGIGLLTSWLLVSLRWHTQKHMYWLSRGWVIALFVSHLFGAFELVTGTRLPYTLAEQEVVKTAIIASTFANPNNYCAFMCLASVFAFYLLLDKGYKRDDLGNVLPESKNERRTKQLWQLFTLGSLAITPIMLFYAGSRLMLIVLAFQVLVFLVTRGINAQTIALVVLGGTLGLGATFNQINKQAVTLSNKQSLSVEQDESTRTRYYLSVDGLWMAESTNYRGVGAGGFEYYIQNEDVPFNGVDVFNPHNFWIEVFAQYGILVFAPFVFWIALHVRIAINNSQKLKKHLGSSLLFLSMMLIISYIPACFANSRFIPQSYNWMFLASMAVVANYTTLELATLKRRQKSTQNPVQPTVKELPV